MLCLTVTVEDGLDVHPERHPLRRTRSAEFLERRWINWSPFLAPCRSICTFWTQFGFIVARRVRLRRCKRRIKPQEPNAMSEGSVDIKDLVKTYVDDRGRPTFTAVKNISLHIENGEFMVLVGPSGCWKSTTLRMVAGLEKSRAERSRSEIAW